MKNKYKVILTNGKSVEIKSDSFEYGSDVILFFDWNEQFGQSNKYMYKTINIEKIETITE